VLHWVGAFSFHLQVVADVFEGYAHLQKPALLQLHMTRMQVINLTQLVSNTVESEAQTKSVTYDKTSKCLRYKIMFISANCGMKVTGMGDCGLID